MTTSKDAATFKRNDNLDKGKLLIEIESLTKALYLDKNLAKSPSSAGRIQPQQLNMSNSKHINEGQSPLKKNEGQSIKDKKSFWNWKPLKALSHVRNRRFNCCFSLDVHAIEGLPSKFNDAIFSVHWKRRDGEVVTSPIKVVEGVAEFEEKLTHTCSIYGSRSGPNHSANYEAKHFLLYAAVQGNSNLDLGKHRVDLTRLLPLTLEELEDENSSGTWTTAFKLSGEAKGAVMNVSFGYLVLGDGIAPSAPNNKKVLQLLDSKASSRNYSKNKQGDGRSLIRRAGSLPANLRSSSISHADDVKVLHEVPPSRTSDFSNSVNKLYEKFDQGNLDLLVDDKCEIEVPAHNGKHVKSSSQFSLLDPFRDNMLNDEINSELSSIENGMEGERSTLVENGDKDANDQNIVSSNCPCSDVGVSGQQEADIKSDEFVKLTHCYPSDLVQENTVNDKNFKLSVADKGVEFPEEKSALVEDGATIADDQDILSSGHPLVCSEAGASRLGEAVFERDETVIHDCDTTKRSTCTKELLLEDLESVLSNVAELEKEALDSPDATSEANHHENLVEDGQAMTMPSHSLDDLAEKVADEFLSMLGIDDSSFTLDSEGEPESPRERLLREFEKEAKASGCPLFGFGIDEEVVEDDEYCAPIVSGWDDFAYDSDCLAAEYSEYPRIRAKVMEDLETQALMQEWGLDENEFKSSPPSSRGGFSSPIGHSPNDFSELPPLGEGIGSFIQTKSGGFLRSMNPTLFEDAKSGGSLIMQVSSPVVVPAELGSGVMDIVQHLASMGIEKLSIQANKLMPLEDITGRTMQQIAWEAAPHLETFESQKQLQDKLDDFHVTSAKKKNVKETSSRKPKKIALDDVDSEFVSLEDLAPLAIDKIEALSIEGLRIQSGMSDEEAPSNINAKPSKEFSAPERKKVTSFGSMGVEGIAGLKLLALKDNETNGDDGLMGLSLTLDQWMKLDSGEIDETERLSERTSKILAAHHAQSTDLKCLAKRHEKGPGRRRGLLGNNLTVSLMVQLRDPLRNYEPVGTPMLALIQVERVFVPPKPKIYCKVSEARDNNIDEDDLELVAKNGSTPELKEEKTQEEDLISQYKISEVHVSGFKSDLGKKKLWGSAAQQQSGSRWLLANGMGKGSNTTFVKPKIVTKSSLPETITSQPGDTLWSISARVHGNGAKWKGLAALNPHIRNPNVIISNQTIKLR